MNYYMAFTNKGQTKAAATFKGNFGVYGPILFKVCMQVADWPSLMICYMAFKIKGQSKATAALKGNFGVYVNDFFEAFSFQPGGWSSVKLLGFTFFCPFGT